MKIIIFADLDGTILDENYHFHEIKQIIKNLLSMNAAIVLCSSKTRTEIEFYRKEMGINDPFISENGAAIFVPRNYFQEKQKYAEQTAQYSIIKLGISYSAIRQAFEKIKQECGCQLVGFGDMTAKEISEQSRLTIDFAKLAKQREFSEPFSIEEGQEKKVFDAIRREHLGYVKGGKYYHLVGNHNKAKATIVLSNLYAQEFDELLTIGVGDGPNDLEMLKAVDQPFIVKENRRLVWEKILKTAGEKKSP
jgi:mannosyl-3-phosphoglycerate phosphatase